jgi:hypothetical protein
VADGVQTSILVPDLGCADLAMLLPLWAEAPASSALTALLDDQLLNPGRFWRPHGLPLLPANDTDDQAPPAEGSVGAAMLWNSALGEALLTYGRGEQAGVLLERLMTAIVKSLRAEHALCQVYDPETGQGRGDRHAACGGVPLSLVLACTGVQLISPTKVGLRGRNVLAGPVTVAWRGLQVTRDGEVSRIVFPDGQSVELQGEEPLVIEQQPRRTVATRSG